MAIAMTKTRILRKFSQITYMQYKSLPPEIQDEYLEWAQREWEKQWAQLQFERQGGISGIAKKKAEQEVKWLERVTTWSYLHAYTPRVRCRKSSRVCQSMYNSVSL
ncbi:hypothetical protein ZYGR_0AY02290 [Zygosaccharomyces rouxii]|uniref:Uncharacterized protein n=1 Tax=Zygosaccharomyces rouxii TaxID=4956 RepID=A0A1Q3AJB9_ZYGRO|nr:hypothetical protein ZYGR_0AY02290 [Zygosaccharomyces rouxii]